MSYFKEEWQMRVLDEDHELREKLARLIVFIDKEKNGLAKSSPESYKLLQEQCAAMKLYLDILGRRIRNWDN